MGERSAEEIVHFLYEQPQDLFYDELSDNETDGENIEDERDDEEDADEGLTDASKNGNELEPATSGHNRSFIKGRNHFKWSINAPEPKGKRSSVYLPCIKHEAKNVSTPLEAWSLLFSENILEIIVRHTNEEIDRKVCNIVNKQPYHANLEIIEMKALFGLLYFGGVVKHNHTNVEDMWSPRYGSNFYRAVMSLNRFKFLCSCLRFDDKNTRIERRSINRLAPIKEIWDIFIENCHKYYSPSTNCTLDNQLLGFRGRFGAKVYIGSKPDKYGIKIICINDSQTAYMFNAEPYVGRVPTEGTEKVSSYYVRKLSEPIHHSERNITCNNSFMSIEILYKMKSEYSLTMVGTLRKNEREIPSSFVKSATAGTIRFAHDNGNTLVSYCPKRNKVVVLLSGLHKTGKIDKDTQKPEILIYYNKTKGGTDTFDQLCKCYSVSRATLRWPLRYFFGMLDQAGVNATILHNLRLSNQCLTRRDFIKQLAFSLVQPHMQARLYMDSLPKTLKSIMREILQLDEDIPARSDKLEKRKRCVFCHWKCDKKTLYCCTLCQKAICEEHRTHFCKECAVSYM